MTIRQFADNDGRVWEVWETRPARTQLSAALRERLRSLHNSPTASGIMQGLEHGWLTFRSGVEKRRLAPIPENWDHARDEQLGRWCRRAAAVPIAGGEDQPLKEQFGERRVPT
jgi:hypothetical protein